MPDVGARLQEALSDRYRIRQEMSGGGLSRVFLADELTPPRLVVIKVLPPDLSSAVSHRRFEREITLVARLQHPHIVPLLATGTAAGIAYFTMPYIDGETLRARLVDGQPRPTPEVVRLMREVADALSYAHAHGVVHRDIKPENILLSGGHACVTDFGVARAVRDAAEDTGSTTVGIALGTPAYMAPEQAVADPTVDHRADLYALGVIAYEMLAGTPPFVGRSGARLLAAHAIEPPRPVSELRPDCPPALASLVMQCLAKSPDERPQQAADIIGRLDALGTPGATAAFTGHPRRGRRRAIVAAAAAGLLLVVGGAVAFVPRDMRATALTLLTRRDAALVASRVFVAPFDNRTGDTTLQTLGVMTADWIGQALSRVPGVEVVDARTALATQEVVQRIPWPLRTYNQARAMAQEVGAGTLVAGTIYREGDSLTFQATIADVRTGRLVRALTPVRGTRAAPSRVLVDLQSRVTASLALANDTTAGTMIASFAEPPSLEAYQETYRGIEAYFRGDDSSEYAHLEHAARLDSTYTTPLVFLAFARTYNFDYATADTVVQRAERLSDRLAPAERAMLDHVKAMIGGRAAEAVRAAERFMTLMPGSQESPLLLASIALSTFKPRLASRALERIDPDRGLNLAGPFYWLYQAEAAAQLGNWSRALTMARAGRRRFPESYGMCYEMTRALVRLGRTREAEQTIAAAPSSGGSPLFRRARLASDIWGELRATGDTVAADRLIRRYAGLLDAAGDDTTRLAAYTRGGVLWRAGRATDATAMLSTLAARDTGTDRLYDLAALGIAQARAGNRDAAARVERELASVKLRYERGTPFLLRASIVAALGDRERAVLLLQQGLGLGMSLQDIGGDLFGNSDLEPLFGYPPFEQLIAPTG